MTEPFRLEMLRFARRVVAQQAQQQIAQLDRWIADEQQRQQELRQGEERRPPPPEWLLEMSLGGQHPLTVHVGDCYAAGKRSRPVSRDQAMRALVEGVEACTHCRADTELGVLD
jgi:hypothetical protein